MTIVLYAYFLQRQMGPQRADFQEPGACSEQELSAAAASSAPITEVLREHRSEILLRGLVLARHVDALERGQVEEAREAHHGFHFALYRGAQSEWLLRAIEPAWRNSERYLFAAPEGDVDHAATQAEHGGILAACARGDAAAAAEATRRHLEGAGRRIRTLLAHRVRPEESA